MSIRLRIILAGIAATASLAGTASAQTSSTPAKPDTAVQSAPFAQEKAAGDEVLEKATAREDLSQTAKSTQSSTVTGNSINGPSTTGGVSFSDNAFQTASGMTVINANSGNNVSMNASMNVNIVMVPASPQP
ncbi:MAG TPA: hypothetical protein VF631_03165 [Allosphingosinicella sp.]|jgi:hypothetical protein|uniref:hypothetical protein n=1 Tax=Allosphingosinicella sp. TaxID=2823234 RepID=UPI002F27F602